MEPDREADIISRVSEPAGAGKSQVLRAIAGVVACVVLIAWLWWLSSPSALFPVGERIEVPSGTSLRETAQLFAREHAVRSSLALQLIIIARSQDAGVKAGVYQFAEPLSLFGVARAVLSGTHGAPLLIITIPEGLRNAEIDAMVSEQLPQVEPGEFALAATGREGFLMPETYHVPEAYTAEQLVTLMEDTFAEKTKPFEPAFATSVHSREELIIMASILEREALDEESMKLVSGILWKRLESNMPLQVDASFAYLLDKTSKEVTKDDLALDSPYNTYKYAGLPPTPFNNPGLQAIQAALFPTDSPYLYYLTAPDGTFHYAKTFEEHKENKARYLD